MAKTLAFYNLGCKANQYETDKMMTQAEALGCTVVSFDEPADAYVVNSCTVTSTADHKSRQAVRRALSNNPGSKIILTGCYAMLKPKLFDEFPNDILFLDNREKEKFGALIEQYVLGARGVPSSPPVAPPLRGSAPYALRLARPAGSVAARLRELVPRELPLHTSNALAKRPKLRRVRANLMIQNGCDHFCTFCVIPITRGRSRSKPLDEIVRETEALVAEGAREIVLTGINLGSYGREVGMNLSDAVRAIAAVPGVRRVRLSSLEPQHIDDTLLETILSEPKIAPYLYAPLQSGDDDILLAMKRGYTAALYREIIDHTRRKLPNASINTDVIVGFPGETDQSFENTYRFCEEIGFTRMHIFPYSKRPHTHAARMEGPVHETIVKARAARLQALRLKLMGQFHRQWIGQMVSVLVEFVDPETGLHEGMTPEYIRVFFESSENLMGQIATVRITQARDEDVVGELADVHKPGQ